MYIKYCVHVQEDFLQQMNILKSAFADERDELESRVQQLQNQLRDRAGDDNPGVDLKLRDAEHRLRLMKEAESRNQKQVDELSRANAQIREERNQVEGEKAKLRKELEDKIHKLVMEQEHVVAAGHVRALQSARQPSNDLDKVY
jgi:chromosome segregation ATPase